ncbi:hypothetical protein [Desulfolucanica intricata]|uniref:hypothetical protein n=1 Tax=Desulfolucanica intricata TaxID=1285191 RepID=UPI00083206F5|nr:hypothetical protein [Desulfolucanica intricata]
MQRIKIFVLSLLIIGLISLLGCQSSNKSTSEQLSKLTVSPMDKTGSLGSIVDLAVDTQIPDFPSNVMVYKVKKPVITKEQVLVQAEKLGVSGDVRETSVDLNVKSAEGEYIVDKETGSFHYLTKEFNLQGFPLKSLLSDEEYKKLATDFLTEKGLLKENAVFKDVNKDNVYISGADSEKRSPFMIEVRFGHKDLNGIEFNGVGPKISVYFGENGKIIGAASVWREVEPYKEYPIISVNESFNQIKAGKATIYDVRPNDKGTVKNVKLMYMSDPVGYNQEFVIPYYQITGINSESRPFTGFTRAIPENLFEEKPLPSYSAPQGRKNR